ncbi:hypothetical protein ACFSKL_20460 [Belliella marina]|uniref:Outer membrane protein beta-barrel domain-containing protein n=1 Tax=Belliella marina TaxID=1644146 RepID=A0ABW4VV14_9BACT
MISEKMKELLIIALLLVSVQAFAQEKSEWFVRANGNVVQSYQFGPGFNIGLGAHLGYKPTVKEERLWRSVFLLGIETVPGCIDPANCNSWWYNYNFRVQGGLERMIFHSETTKVMLGLGGSVFAGRKLRGKYTMERNGIIIAEDYYKSFEGGISPQVSVRYSNKRASKKMTFGYAVDWVFVHEAILHGLTLDWRIK